MDVVHVSHLVDIIQLHELLGLEASLLGPVRALAAVVAVLGAAASLDAEQCAPLHLFVIKQVERRGTQAPSVEPKVIRPP